MTILELFSTLKNLPRADKLKVMQFLVAELAQEEEPSLQPGATYPVWSPLDSHEAAHQLAQFLEAEQSIAFVRSNDIDLKAQGIDREQAENLRSSLVSFSEDWNSLEMGIYDNYD